MNIILQNVIGVYARILQIIQFKSMYTQKYYKLNYNFYSTFVKYEI